MDTYFLGARLFYWLYLLLTLAFGGGVVAYWMRERIIRKVLTTFQPEKLIKIGMIYPNGWIRRFYRLIPTNRFYMLDGGAYNYNDSAVLKNSEAFALADKDDSTRLKFVFEGKEYYYDDQRKLKQRFERYPEIFYRYGKPWPLDMTTEPQPEPASQDKDGVKVRDITKYNASDLEKLIKSTMVNQLLTSFAANAGAIVVILLVILLLAVLANLGINTGLIHIATNSTGAVHP